MDGSEVEVAFVVASTAVCAVVRAAPRAARVVAALPAAVYLEVPAPDGPGVPGGPSEWLALLARDAVRVPIGLVTAVPRSRDPFDGVTVGSAATVGGGQLRLPGGAAYRPLRYWDPSVPRLSGALATRGVARRTEALVMMSAGLPADDVRGWRERAGVLEAALAPGSPSVDALGEAAATLIGLGAGLTPAGDDVLAGALVALAAAADEPRRRALVAAVQPLLPRTVPLSAALVRQACHGRAVPEVSVVLRALAGSGDLDAALAGLALVGHTSGPALALGIRAALRARTGGVLGRVA